jgi:MFS family permease
VTTAEAIRQPRGAFAALTVRSYRIYLAGQSLANTGSWMQSIAQDWLIFDVTHSSAAVGVTMALQFGPIMLLGMHAGIVADRLPKRRILLTTQLLNAASTAILAVITLAGAVKAADVYVFALLSGVIFAFDVPARQAFVTDVVPEGQLRAAISLNAATFQAARLVGPALASLLIVCAGTGWVFAANAACYLGPTIGLLLLRPGDLQPSAAPAAPAARSPRAARDAVAYVRRRPEIGWTIFLVGMLGTFGLNFPIVLTAMAKSAYGGDASTYGLFNIVLGLGSAAGAVLAGAGARPRTRTILSCAALFGVLQVAGALTRGIAVFAVLLAAMGLVNLICQAMANSAVQLAVDPEIRGRVMGLYMLVFIGGTPIGALTVGEITSHYGARAGMAFCGAVPAVAAVVVAAALSARARTRGTAAARHPDIPGVRTSALFPHHPNGPYRGRRGRSFTGGSSHPRPMCMIVARGGEPNDDAIDCATAAPLGSGSHRPLRHHRKARRRSDGAGVSRPLSGRPPGGGEDHQGRAGRGGWLPRQVRP